MIGATRKLDYFNAYICLREPDKSEDKVECKATDSRAMDLTTPWYRRGGTPMKLLIPCSLGGRAVIMKGVEEVENIEANSKYQDKAEGADAKELHKTGVNELIIKIAESERLRIDARVLD
ncbi:hypothetical protein BHM03_00036962 [Ensete ventricosum]|nr:hypothetical protein BHM03_00036962 [Ensete ventricosum]